MPLFKIQHVTRYQYDRDVQESVNEIKIFPYATQGQELLQHELAITAHPEILYYQDYWGNKTGVFNVLPPHKELVIDSRLLVRTTKQSEEQPNFTANFEQLSREVNGQIKLLELSTLDPIASQAAIDNMASTVLSADRSVAATVQNCCDYIFETFSYIKGITTIETTVDEILEQKAGVCQDFAHLMLYVLRSLHIPSRYVSGYICPNKNGLRGEGATHAWVEAWIPNYGWAGIDPTNNVWVTTTHVKLAVGRDFRDCSPVKGTFKGLAKQNLSVFVSVGYEDGQIFEELNDVGLEAVNGEKQPDFHMAGAQQ
jgi:transglutaminase-like putative cysteine protease